VDPSQHGQQLSWAQSPATDDECLQLASVVPAQSSLQSAAPQGVFATFSTWIQQAFGWKKTKRSGGWLLNHCTLNITVY
jgi:hypothetical protein